MIVTSLALLAHSSALAAPKFRDPDTRRQWHEISWGSRPKEDMKCAPGEFKNLVLCERAEASGDRAVGSLKAERVTYRYFEDRLFRIDVAFATDEVSEELATVLHQVYGPGAWEAASRSESWKGDSIAINWQRTLRAPGATLTYLYLPLVADVTEASAAAGGTRTAEIADAL